LKLSDVVDSTFSGSCKSDASCKLPQDAKV
jgi:hypothetical protein